MRKRSINHSEIIRLYCEEGLSGDAIAKKFGVNHSLTCRIGKDEAGSPHPSGWGGIGLSRKLFMLTSPSPDVCFA
jgi:hypothetical protein